MSFREVRVQATFTPDGVPRPRSLRWEERTLHILDVGRRWAANDGQHLLVRVADGRVFELRTDSARWWAALRTPPTAWV
jgi:hypothetical protein